MKIALLAGAGASTGVSREKFPTTAGFYEQYVDKSKLRDQPLFSILDDYVRREKLRQLKASGQPIDEPLVVDIEEILFAARELRDVYSQFQSTSNSVARFAAFHEKIQSYGSYGNNATGLFESTVPQLDGLVRQINELVHRAYVARPSKDELGTTWIPLLRQLDSSANRMDVFTTNYDLVLEAAVRYAEVAVSAGNSDGVTQSLSLDAWTAPYQRASNLKGLLTKLHGSLHWLKGDDDEIELTGSSFKDHQRQVALYPGYKGIPSESPYNLFHDYFANRIAESEVVIVIGFAFRDDYINGLFQRHLTQLHRLLVIDPRASDVTVPGNANVARCNLRFGDPDVEKFVRAFLLDKPMPQFVSHAGITT